MVIIFTFLTIHFGTYQLNKLIQVIEHLHNRNQFDNKNRNFQEISVYMCSFSDKKINKLCYCHFNICVLTWFLVPSWTMAFRKFSLVSIFPILFDFFFHEIEFTSCLLVSFTIRTSVSNRCVCCRRRDNNNNNSTVSFLVSSSLTTQHRNSMEYTQDEYEALNGRLFYISFDKQT